MLDNSDILASDAERQQAILRLHDACGEGRLTLDEFSERVKAVFASRTRGQLAPIIADLPRAASLTQYLPEAKHVTFALLSDLKRKGRWRIDGETTAISVLASCTLDLRQAVVQGRDVVINTYVVLGSLKIIVPPGTPVELAGFAILGNRDSKVDDEPLPGVPVVRVRGLTMLGSVDVVTQDRAEDDSAAADPKLRVDRPELLES